MSADDQALTRAKNALWSLVYRRGIWWAAARRDGPIPGDIARCIVRAASDEELLDLRGIGKKGLAILRETYGRDETARFEHCIPADMAAMRASRV